MSHHPGFGQINLKRHIHVIPVGNGEPMHMGRQQCWCHPTEVDKCIWAHHAKDGRERFERQGLSNPSAAWVQVLDVEIVHVE